ncbi:MAG: beta-galactosidase [Planctomycetota bacterium]|jgi:hypothetical protein
MKIEKLLTHLKSKYFFMFLTLIISLIIIFGTVGLANSTDPPDKPFARYLSLNIWVWETGATLNDLITLVELAKKKGFNTISLAIPWSAIERSPNEFTFEWLDNRIDYIVEQGLSVVLRVTYTLYPHWIRKDHFMKKEDGSIFKGPWKNGMLSISDIQVRTWMERLLVRVVKRYQNRYDSKPIVYYSVPFAPMGETEYWIDYYLDYSPQSRADFQEWLQIKYVTINELNRIWDTSYSTFSKVSIPKSNEHGSSTWTDWINFRTFALKRLFDQLAEAVHNIDKNAKIGVQFGSIWDGISGARGTYDAAKLIENVDWVIVDDAPSYNHKFSMDLLRTIARGKRIGNEIGEPLSQLLRKDLGPVDTVLTHGLETYAYGGDMLHFANWDRTFKYPAKVPFRAAHFFKKLKDLGYQEGLIHIDQPLWASALSRLALEAKEPVSIIEQPQVALYISTIAQYLHSHSDLPGFYKGIIRGVDTYRMIKETYRMITNIEAQPIAIVTDSMIVDNPTCLNRYTQGIYLPAFNKIISDKVYAVFQKVNVPLYSENRKVGTRNEYGKVRAPTIFRLYPDRKTEKNIPEFSASKVISD